MKIQQVWYLCSDSIFGIGIGIENIARLLLPLVDSAPGTDYFFAFKTQGTDYFFAFMGITSQGVLNAERAKGRTGLENKIT
jgi:hypothetical protein